MKLSKDEIFFINTLQSISGVSAKDCIIDNNTISFLVKKDEMGRAIGKNGDNIKKLGKKIGKSIEIIGHYGDIVEFLKNAFGRAELKDIEVKDGEKHSIVLVHASSMEKREILRNRKRFERIKSFSTRNYSIGEVKLR